MDGMAIKKTGTIPFEWLGEDGGHCHELGSLLHFGEATIFD